VARSDLTASRYTRSFAPSTTNNNNQIPFTMKTPRTRSIEPAVMTIGQVCLLLVMMVVVPF